MNNTLDQQIINWMADFDVPAASVVIIENKAIRYRFSYGTVDNQPIQAETIISAQSLTKPMVAFRALQLVEDGSLDLDTPLSDYLDSPYPVDDPRITQITARYTLSHATGFPNWRDPENGLEIKFDPGCDYHYSGEGYCYLQTAMEAITGERLENLMQPLFVQLCMTDSYMQTFPDDFREHWLIQHFDHLNTNAAFSLMTSADDYAKFMLTMLDDNYQSITDVMLSPEQGVAARDGFYWGNGWGIEDTPKGRYFWQWGAGVDERHLAIGNRDTGWAVVILTTGNDGTDNGLTLAHKIIQQFDADPGKWFDWLSPSE